MGTPTEHNDMHSVMYICASKAFDQAELWGFAVAGGERAGEESLNVAR